MNNGGVFLVIDHRKMLKFYSQFIGVDDLCFDVGANIGERTSIFLALGARVVAVEPQPYCRNALQKKFGQEKRVTLVPKALGSSEGDAELFISNAHTISSMNSEWIHRVKKSGRFANYKWPRKVKVPVTTLDNLITQYGLPVFCKIDVEGYEPEVVKGLSHPIQALSFEFTHELVENSISCIKHLSQIANYHFNYSLGNSMALAQNQWVDADSIASTLRGLRGRLPWGDVYAKKMEPGR